MSITISGNLANYFIAHKNNINFRWQYDFHKGFLFASNAYFFYLAHIIKYSINQQHQLTIILSQGDSPTTVTKLIFSNKTHIATPSLQEIITTATQQIATFPHTVTTAALATFMYWMLMPCLLHLVMRWRNLQRDCTFSEVLCLYGYSLCIYIPVSVRVLICFHWWFSLCAWIDGVFGLYVWLFSLRVCLFTWVVYGLFGLYPYGIMVVKNTFF